MHSLHDVTKACGLEGFGKTLSSLSGSDRFVTFEVFAFRPEAPVPLRLCLWGKERILGLSPQAAARRSWAPPLLWPVPARLRCGIRE